MSDRDQSGGSWTLLTGHGRVLVEIGRDPGARIRDISAAAGLTERTVQAIVADLEAAGYLTRTRTGRRVRYTVNHDSLFRHPAQEGQRVGPFLSLLAAADEDAPTTPGTDDSEMGRRQTLCGRKLRVSSPEPRRRRICDSRNPSRPPVTAGQPALVKLHGSCTREDGLDRTRPSPGPAAVGFGGGSGQGRARSRRLGSPRW
jgi:hypothetical protein